MNTLERKFDQQKFPNGYELANGVAMHLENGENFQIPPDVIKRHIQHGQFVEVRIDSPRFSVHKDAPEKCICPTCNGEMTKPILRHENPASLLELPDQKIPSRGWGENFGFKLANIQVGFVVARSITRWLNPGYMGSSKETRSSFTKIMSSRYTTFIAGSLLPGWILMT